MKLFQYTYMLLSMFAVMVVIQPAKVNGMKESSIPMTAVEKTIVITDTSLGKVAPRLITTKGITHGPSL
jgi:hypothetical protein